MKKILVLILVFTFILTLSSCTVRIDPQGEIEQKAAVSENSIIGSWEVTKADFKKSSDPLKGVFNSVLKNHIKEGYILEFLEDGTANVESEAASYTFDKNVLNLTFDNSKNFPFEVSFKGDEVNIKIEDVIDATLVRK